MVLVGGHTGNEALKKASFPVHLRRFSTHKNSDRDFSYLYNTMEYPLSMVLGRVVIILGKILDSTLEYFLIIGYNYI
jgi:hypothetical protein